MIVSRIWVEVRGVGDALDCRHHGGLLLLLVVALPVEPGPPPMVFDIISTSLQVTETSVDLAREQGLNQCFTVRIETFVKIQFGLDDVPADDSLVHIGIRKGGITSLHLVYHDTKSPVIHTLVVSAAQHQLWSQVLGSSAQSVGLGGDDLVGDRVG